MASFYVIRGKDNGQHFAVRGAHATIGREATNQIQLRDTEVSRRHARVIRADASNFEIVDNQSSNGTFVNGRRVERQVLKSGDRVQIGRSLMIFTGGPEIQSKRSIDAVEIVTEGGAEELSQIRSTLDSHYITSPGDGSSASVFPAVDLSDESNDVPSSHNLSESKSGYTDSGSRASSLEILYQVSQAINRTVDLSDLLTQVLDLVFHWIDCDRGCILMNDDITGQLTPISSLDRKRQQEAERVASHPLTISRTILDYVRKSKEGVLTSNAQDDSRWNNAESVSKLGVHEAICVPMLGRYGFVGAIYVDTSVSPGVYADRNLENTFNDEHLKLMLAIAGQAALAIEDTQFYRAMVQAERLAVMGQTIANLSHHVKNILQGVGGGDYLVEDGLKNGDLEIIRKGWGIVKRNQERISNLVMDMLTYSKDREPDLVMGDLRLLVDDVVQLMQTRASEAGVNIKWNRPKNALNASFDSEAIHRALLNVLANAIDATADASKGLVVIEAQLKDEMVQMTVMDNGAGIQQEDESRIFVPFESTKGSSGTGLGLPVSQKIMREHGGDISFRTKLGQGTAFILYWPDQPDSNLPPTLPG